MKAKLTVLLVGVAVAICLLTLNFRRESLPPSPPGFRLSKPGLAPKTAEPKRGLRFAATLPQFEVTNIRLSAGQVSLAWQNGSPPYQVMGSASFDQPWNPAGPPTMLLNQSFPVGTNALWKIQGAVPLLFINETNQPRLTWQTPIIDMSDSLGNFTVQRGTDGTNFSTIQTLDPSARNFSDTATPPEYYRLQQTTANGVTIPYPVRSVTGQTIGSVLSARRFGGTGSDFGNAVVIDSQNNLIMVGAFQNTIDFGGLTTPLTSAGGYDMFIVKFSAAGVAQWAVRFGNASGGEQPICVALDNNNNIIVGGNFTGTGNFGGADIPVHGASFDAFIAKYSSTGVHQWSYGFGGIVADQVSSIAVDSQNNIYLTGWYQNDSNPTDMANLQMPRTWGQSDTFLAKFSPTGTAIFATNFYNGSADYGWKVLIDKRINPSTSLPYDNIVLIGYFNGNINLGGGQFDSNWMTDPGGYIGRFVKDGVLLWSKRYGVPGGNTGGVVTRFWCGAMDSNGDILVGGDFAYATDLGGGQVSVDQQGTHGAVIGNFIAKFSGANGAYIWASYITDTVATGAGLAQPWGVAVDAQNNVFIAGQFQGQWRWGNGTKIMSSAGTGNVDGYIAKYGSGGAFLWAQQLGCNGYALCYSVLSDSLGNSFTSGYINGAATIGGGLISQGYDCVLVKTAP